MAGVASRRLAAAVRSMVAGRERPLAVVMNEAKLNYDGSLDWSGLERVAHIKTFDDTAPQELPERADGAQIIITKEMPVPGSVINLLPPSVKLIAESGTGFNNIDIEAARVRGITVSNIPTYSTEAMAHIAITMVLNLSCSFMQQQKKLALRDRLGWRTLGDLPHFEVQGKTLGLVGGRGTIGSRVTDIALAFGMKVLISSRRPEPVGKAGVEVVDVPTLLSRSDFVSIHCPLNDQTRGLIGAKELAMMKPTSYLVNTARGAIVREAELVEALRAGVIAGAALDVQEVEPLPVDSPLFDLPNVVLTPHIGWQRKETRQRMVDTVVCNCKAFLAGSPVNVVS